MNIDKELKEYDLEEVFNHDKYVKYMDSKVVRNPRTNTLLDFISEEEQKELNRKGIEDLSCIDPTPEDIQNHMDYTFKVYLELRDKNPNDEFINFLGNSDEGCIVMVSTNWYRKYGFNYNNKIISFK